MFCLALAFVLPYPWAVLSTALQAQQTCATLTYTARYLSMSDGNATTGLIPVSRWWNGECLKELPNTSKISKQTKDTLKHWNFKSSRNLVRYCCWTSVPLDLQSCRPQRLSRTALTSQGPPSQDRSIHSPNPRSHPSCRVIAAPGGIWENEEQTWIKAVPQQQSKKTPEGQL